MEWSASRGRRWIWMVVFAFFTFGCGAATEDSPTQGAADTGGSEAVKPALPYAASVESFSPGEGAGYGSDEMPGVVLGPPEGEGVATPGLDVVTLGIGGTIVLAFGDRRIVDEEGADFVVFENPFFINGNRDQLYRELGEVSVSRDGEEWRSFDCEPESGGEGRWPGCAGWTPTRVYDASEMLPIEPEQTGGDAFDLAAVGLERARYVRIRGISERGAAPKTGFDLDAVGIVHGEPAAVGPSDP